MKTTQLNLKIFKKEIERLVELFGLKEWGITIEMGKLDNDSLAELDWDYIGRFARFTLASNRPKEKQTEFEILRSAKHEVAHLLTTDLRSLAQSRFLTPPELDVATEAFARRMEKVL